MIESLEFPPQFLILCKAASGGTGKAAQLAIEREVEGKRIVAKLSVEPASNLQPIGGFPLDLLSDGYVPLLAFGFEVGAGLRAAGELKKEIARGDRTRQGEVVEHAPAVADQKTMKCLVQPKVEVETLGGAGLHDSKLVVAAEHKEADIVSAVACLCLELVVVVDGGESKEALVLLTRGQFQNERKQGVDIGTTTGGGDLPVVA